jgi:hypothetical protein
MKLIGMPDAARLDWEILLTVDGEENHECEFAVAVLQRGGERFILDAANARGPWIDLNNDVGKREDIPSVLHAIAELKSKWAAYAMELNIPVKVEEKLDRAEEWLENGADL